MRSLLGVGKKYPYYVTYSAIPAGKCKPLPQITQNIVISKPQPKEKNTPCELVEQKSLLFFPVVS